MTRKIELTVKQYAALEGVTERTVWSWISKGAVPVRRTPGGRVRIFTLSDDVLALKYSEVSGSPYR